MKKIIAFCISIFYTVLMYAQNEAQGDIGKIYPQAFEKEVKAKNKSGISDLYLNGDVILNVSLKGNSTADYYFKSTASDWAAMVHDQITVPYELRISEEDYQIVGNFAISSARFDEYMSNTHNGDGYDMFTYIRTTEGWKISHMDVTLAQDQLNLPEKEKKTFDEAMLNGIIENIEQGLLNNDLSPIKFMETNEHIALNYFDNNILSSTKKYERTAISSLLEEVQLKNTKLVLGDPKVIDGHMAYVIGKLGTNDVVVTLVHQGSDWLVTSFNINI